MIWSLLSLFSIFHFLFTSPPLLQPSKVKHIDNYENIFVNITDAFVRDCLGKNTFRIVCKKDTIPLVKAYGDVREGFTCALFASNGYLQIAVNRGRAASLLGMSMDNDVYVVLGDDLE